MDMFADDKETFGIKDTIIVTRVWGISTETDAQFLVASKITIENEA